MNEEEEMEWETLYSAPDPEQSLTVAQLAEILAKLPPDAHIERYGWHDIVQVDFDHSLKRVILFAEEDL